MNTRTKILFFASNPKNTKRLALDIEARSISDKIEASEYRDSLEFVTIWAARPIDLLDKLNKHKPAIVHFSGHGSGVEGLALMDDRRKYKLVSTDALNTLFSTVKDNIRLVVLNACFSAFQVQAISEVIECVVGMNKWIGDEAAILFAAQFYSALASGRSVKGAFEQGKLSLMLESIHEENTPKLLHRSDVDPTKIFLVKAEKDYNIPKIINLLKNSFNDTELQQFCMSHFKEVYNSFSDGMNKDQKVLKLVDYAIRHLIMDSLLDKIASTNQPQFELNKPYYS